MNKDLIVSSTPQETKVALLDDGIVSEIFIEREAHRGIVGNLYKGKVTRVLPGIDSWVRRPIQDFHGPLESTFWSLLSLGIWCESTGVH